MGFRVVEIIDGDTFRVSPNWVWNGTTGDRVRPIGYDTPENSAYGYYAASKKLAGLILGKQVELNDAKTISYGRVVCQVLLGGIDIARYFKQYA